MEKQESTKTKKEVKKEEVKKEEVKKEEKKPDRIDLECIRNWVLFDGQVATVGDTISVDSEYAKRLLALKSPAFKVK